MFDLSRNFETLPLQSSLQSSVQPSFQSSWQHQLPSSYQPQFQDWTVPTTLQSPAMRMPDGTAEDDFFITDINESEAIITLSQADEFIRNEAEAGRIHGQGTYIYGYWEHSSEP